MVIFEFESWLGKVISKDALIIIISPSFWNFTNAFYFSWNPIWFYHV